MRLNFAQFSCRKTHTNISAIVNSLVVCSSLFCHSILDAKFGFVYYRIVVVRIWIAKTIPALAVGSLIETHRKTEQPIDRTNTQNHPPHHKYTSDQISYNSQKKMRKLFVFFSFSLRTDSYRTEMA